MLSVGNLDYICVKFVKYINLDIGKDYTNAYLGCRKLIHEH